MARPRKTGLSYFPLDCVLDIKVEELRAVHGNDGFAAWIIILQEIYQTENGDDEDGPPYARCVLPLRYETDRRGGL